MKTYDISPWTCSYVAWKAGLARQVHKVYHVATTLVHTQQLETATAAHAAKKISWHG